jgi:hypothetical protein
MSDAPNNAPVCPCDAFIHPKVIFNPPGRDEIAYRAGDYHAFREALLRSLPPAPGRPAEVQLALWRPGATGDLAVQMVEWWAYLADILTFYNERIANEDYLRTAILPESVNGLIRLLGYRPRPGIGAKGQVAALVNNPKPFKIPQGFQIQSKPGPGQQPQIFEVDATTPVGPPDVVSADPPPGTSLADDGGGVLLRGSVTDVKPGDRLLLINKNWPQIPVYMLSTVTDAKPVKAPRGKTNTRLTFDTPPSGGQAKSYRLQRSTQTARLWPYLADTVITDNVAVLDSIKRDIKAGDAILIEIPGSASPTPLLVSVTGTDEVVFYANTTTSSDPTKPPPQPTVPVPIPITRIYYSETGASDFNTSKASAVVSFAWRDVGELIGAPVASAGSDTASLQAAASAQFPVVDHAPILLEDSAGNGAVAQGSVSVVEPTSLQLLFPPGPVPILTPPLNVLFNLLPISRGKSVIGEILGSGDASFPGQEFVLQNSPLTYLLSGDPTAGGSYRSTLRVWVDGVEWKEVPSFYGQPPTARVFVTREDEQQKTHVLFGDGANGARLSSGSNNVVANYRYGSGADAPAAGALTTLLQPVPGLKAIKNPVAVGGGADPDPPDQIRRYGPQSVLAFGRAVSGDDYETIAAQAPGVRRARAYWAWDAAEQRTMVKIFVGDDAAAVRAAQTALAAAADPNRPVRVEPATPVPITLEFSVRRDPLYDPDKLIAAVRAALLDPDMGLFGANAVRIGQAIFTSQIYAACLRVPGTLAVHSLTFSVGTGAAVSPEESFVHFPGEGGFYSLQDPDLTVSVEGAGNV